MLDYGFDIRCLCSLGTQAEQRAFCAGSQRVASSFEKLLSGIYNAAQHGRGQAVKQLPGQQRKGAATGVSVVVLGATGAGKSTLLNALLKESALLPTNCMRACTATVIEMLYNEAPEVGQPYTAEVEMVSEESWREEVQAMLATMSEHASTLEDIPENEAALEAATQLAKRAEEAVAKLKSVYGASTDLSGSSAEVLLSDPRMQSVLDSTVTLPAATGVQLQALLTKYVDSSNSADGALWPLVKRVTISGPWELLMGGLRLVDAPGTHDDNAARDRVVKDRLSNADIVLLVSNIRRAINDKTIKEWLPLSLRQWMACNGKMGQLAYAVSQSDVLTRSEIVKNLSLPTTTTITQAAQARNEFTRKRITADFWRGVDQADLPINTASKAADEKFDIPVFTCSAIEYQQMARVCQREDGCSAPVFSQEEQTEIPALQQFLKSAMQTAQLALSKAGALLLQHDKSKTVGSQSSQQYFEDGEFVAEYAKSTQSTCKRCNEKIQSGEFRLAKMVPSDR